MNRRIKAIRHTRTHRLFPFFLSFLILPLPRWGVDVLNRSVVRWDDQRGGLCLSPPTPPERDLTQRRCYVRSSLSNGRRHTFRFISASPRRRFRRRFVADGWQQGTRTMSSYYTYCWRRSSTSRPLAAAATRTVDKSLKKFLTATVSHILDHCTQHVFGRTRDTFVKITYEEEIGIEHRNRM